MKRTSTKVTGILMAAAVMMTGMTGCSGESTAVKDGKKTALVVNNEEINVAKANFMLRYQQATMVSYYASISAMLGQNYSVSFDAPADSTKEDGETVGESLKADVLTAIEKAFLLRQRAEEYNVSLTEEELAGAKEAAAAFMKDNDDATLKKLGITEEDIYDVIQVYAIQNKMYEPVVADVDKEVSDEEAKQSKISYARVSTVGTEKDDEGNAIELTEEEKAEKKKIAERFMEELKKAKDPKTEAFTEVKDVINKEMNEKRKAEGGSSDDSEDTDVVYVTTSQTTYDEDNVTLADEVKEAAKSLKDGEIYGEIIEGENAYFVLRMDSVIDREATDKEKENIIEERKSTLYDEKLEKWLEESTVTVEKAWEDLKVIDAEAYDMKVDTEEE